MKETNQEFELTLHIPVSMPAMAGITPERVADMFHEDLHDWSDGRYPFAVEVLKNAITICVQRALYEAVSERELKKHHGEYVEFESLDGKVSGKTAKHVLTTEEVMRGVYAYVREAISVSLSQRPTRDTGQTRR